MQGGIITDRNYVKFILAYDYANVFESMELACDEAYELADKIASGFLEWLKDVEEDIYIKYSDYELLQIYCEEISFDKL